MEKVYDMIIIGGGPAGYTAALYAVRAGLDTLLIERLSAGGQMTLTGDIDNYPGFEEGIDGFSLGMKMKQGAERFGAKTKYAEVISVDFASGIKKIVTAEKTYLSKTVVISTGASPKELGIEGEKELVGKGVHYCAHCDGRFYKDKTAIVVGGGNSAFEDALYLSRLAKKVYLIHRRDSFKASRIYQTELIKAENTELILNSTVTGFIADNKISGVVIRNTKTEKTSEILCDGVFISIGRKPITEFLSNSVLLDEHGYIIADESTKTNIDGVYAAGDVRVKKLRQIVTATADGAVAVHYAEEYLGNYDK